MSTWRTKEGKLLRISEMSTKHIKNCISLLEGHLENLLDNTPNCYDFEDFCVRGHMFEIACEAAERKLGKFKTELELRGELDENS